ncbi:MAG: sensor histidine kinase [Aggregatilineales bacterium]
MLKLAQWLEQHHDELVNKTVDALSGETAPRSQVIDAISVFYDGLVAAARDSDDGPLQSVLQDWVAARSAPTEGELTRIVSVLATIKRVNADLIRCTCPAEEAVELLISADNVFTSAIVYLSQLETDALLADMHREVREARAQLEWLDKSKSDFIAVAAHELRTPITLVEGYSGMIRSTFRDWADDEIAGALLDGIDEGVKRLCEIINDMIDVSLISLNMIELHFQPTWLLQIIDAVERGLQSVLLERNLELVVLRDTIPPRPIWADPERLCQVLNKIVTNAIKYTPDGGRIEIRGRELTGFTDITVIDNGIGISPNDLQYIFNMFSGIGDSALHSSSKTNYKGGGPGLGLFISKGILEAHGGNIWAESPAFDEETRPGSIFHILIPMRTAPQNDMINELFSEPRRLNAEADETS